MVTQKSEPTLRWVWIPGGSFHVAGNGSFGNVKTEHEKFSVDAGSTPAGVLGHHLEDEIFGCLSSTDGLSDPRNHSPVPTESSAVPTDNGVERDDEESLFPALTSSDERAARRACRSNPALGADGAS